MARPKKQKETIEVNQADYLTAEEVDRFNNMSENELAVEELKSQIQLTIDMCKGVMENDRSKVMRLKGLKRQLEDVLRKIV